MVEFFWKYKTIHILILLLFLSTILMVNELSLGSNEIKKGIQVICIPFLKISTYCLNGIKCTFENITDFFSLKTKHKKLQGKVRQLQRERLIFAQLVYENRKLRELLKFKERLPFSTIAAEIIGYDPSNWFNTIIINKGREDGVQIYSAVLAYQDGKEGLIGRVIEVDSHTASVLLLTDQNSAIAVKIANADYKGVLYGQNSLYCRLAYIPFDADIKDDDLVVTSGDGGIIPKSLPIGMVKRIEKRGKGLFMEIKVLPFINLSKLENVLVIK